jgi:plasmid maintenance system antidote protein VapI
MALALEDIGWGTAEHWMRMQASYDLAQARRERTAVTAVADFR